MAQDTSENTPSLKFTLPLMWSNGTDIAGSVFIIFIFLSCGILGVWGLLYYSDDSFLVMITIALLVLAYYTYTILIIETIVIDSIRAKVTYKFLKDRNFEGSLKNCSGYIILETINSLRGSVKVKNFLLRFDDYILFVPVMLDPKMTERLKSTLDQNQIPDVTDKIIPRLGFSFRSPLNEAKKLLRDEKTASI